MARVSKDAGRDASAGPHGSPSDEKHRLETALARLLTMRIDSRKTTFEKNQCSGVYAAPSIGPGLSPLPSWT